MRGIVSDIDGKNAIVLSEDGVFRRVKNKNYLIGQRITYHAPEYRRPAALAASFILCMTAVIGSARIYFTPVSYLDVDINPSLRLGINTFNRVIEFTPLNDDAMTLLDTMGRTGGKIDRCIELIVEKSEDLGFINSDNHNVDIEVVSDKQKLYDRTEGCCKIISETDSAVNINVYRADKEMLGRADELDISVGRLRVIEQYGELYGGTAYSNSIGLANVSNDEIKRMIKDADQSEGSPAPAVSGTVSNVSTGNAATNNAAVNNTDADDTVKIPAVKAGTSAQNAADAVQNITDKATITKNLISDDASKAIENSAWVKNNVTGIAVTPEDKLRETESSTAKAAAGADGNNKNMTESTVKKAEQAVENTEKTAKKIESETEKPAESAVKTAEKTTESKAKETEKTTESKAKETGKAAESTVKSIEKTTESTVKSIEKTTESTVMAAEKAAESTAKDTEKAAEAAAKDTEKAAEAAAKEAEKAAEAAAKNAEKAAEAAAKDAEKAAETAAKDAEKAAGAAAKNAEKAAEAAAKDTEKAAETATKNAEKAAETAAKDAEKAAEAAAKDAEKAAEAAAKEAEKAAEAAAKEAEKAAEAAAKETKKAAEVAEKAEKEAGKAEKEKSDSTDD